MGACYHPDATFRDEAFNLRSAEVPAMWHMLCERGKDLRIVFSDVAADEHKGSANWEAWYTFSKSGRKVHNVIHAEFTFKDGKILTHHDTFPFHRWARQALGLPGLLLGWTGFFRKKVQATAMDGLRKFMQ